MALSESETLMTLDNSLKQVFEENQAELPEHQRIGRPFCMDEHHGIKCTRQKGHTGNHVACGADGGFVAEWSPVVQVIFQYDENLRKWGIIIKGVKDETEAKESFNAVALTVRTGDIVIGYLHKVESTAEGFLLTPAVL